MAIIARHQTPRGEVVLTRRDVDRGAPLLDIVVDGVFLMSSKNGISERALARRCLDPLDQQPALRVLVGGLGMGITLAAVLESKNVVLVDVVEIESVIVDWARKHFTHLNGNALSDRRVNVLIDDLVEFLPRCSSTYDVVLLDIDNGPTWLVSKANARMYLPSCLGQLRALLEPGGILGVWSSHRSDSFLETLQQAFDHRSTVDEHVIRENIEGHELEFYLYRVTTAATD